MLHGPVLGGTDKQAELADYLRRSGTVEAGDLDRALMAAAAAGNRLDEVLVELGFITELALRDILQGSLGVSQFDPADAPLEPLASEAVPVRYLAGARCLPVADSAGAATIAMCDPFDDFAAKAISLKLRKPVIRQAISRAQFEAIFASLYGSEWAGPLEADAGEREVVPVGDSDLEVLRDAASDAPVIRFVQRALRQAVEAGASDIHLRPLPNRAEMHFRIDGRLVAGESPDVRLLAAIVSRLKILANLDISERRLPQDGKIRANIGGRPIDIRLATMPHAHGEGAVLRILPGSAAASSLSELGFSPALERGLSSLFSASEGLLLVTGPTGSGKTTTLHAGLRRLMRPDLNIVTIEDPVEYHLEGAVQVQVDEKIGLTFPKILRSLLRQDPDIILVGEIRDSETAKIAVQAALTGHLVLATLHTNSALAAVPRLIDMGIEPYLLAAVLKGAVAQRLVRRLCPSCASRGGSSSMVRGGGCDQCHGSGYVGRVAVAELAVLDSDLSAALSRADPLSPTQMLRLKSGGYRPIREDVESRLAAGEFDPADVAELLHG